MAKEVKSVQVGGTKKLVMDVVKTIFVVFMFLFYMMPFILETVIITGIFSVMEMWMPIIKKQACMLI